MRVIGSHAISRQSPDCSAVVVIWAQRPFR